MPSPPEEAYAAWLRGAGERAPRQGRKVKRSPGHTQIRKARLPTPSRLPAPCPAPTGKARAPSPLTDGDQLDVLPLQKLERHRDVFQLHLSEGGALVVLAVHALLAEYLQQGDESQPVAQVELQVADPLVHAAEVLVAPAGESVLLDPLPGRILRQVLLGHRHDCRVLFGVTMGRRTVLLLPLRLQAVALLFAAAAAAAPVATSRLAPRLRAHAEVVAGAAAPPPPGCNERADRPTNQAARLGWLAPSSCWVAANCTSREICREREQRR